MRVGRTIVLLAGTIPALTAAVPAWAGAHPNLHFLREGSATEVGANAKPVVASKELRAWDEGIVDPAVSKFQVVKYNYVWFNEDRSSYGIESYAANPVYKNLLTSGWVSKIAFTLGGNDDYYYFTNRANGVDLAQSYYVLSTNKAMTSVTVDANLSGEASGKAGVADVKVGLGGKTSQTMVYVGADPDASLGLVFVPDYLRYATGTDATGLWDPVAHRFEVTTDSEWSTLLATYGTAPAGWSFGFDRTSFADSDFVTADPDLRSASAYLHVTADPAALGQTVTYDILTRFALPDGSTSYFSQPILGFEATIPEPSTWLTMVAGFGIIGAAARRRRQRPPHRG